MADFLGMANDDGHPHAFGPFELSRFGGEPVRRCTTVFCTVVSLDGDAEA